MPEPLSLEIRETVFSEGSQYFRALLQDMAQAKSSIDLEAYTFELDSLGEKVIDQLAAANRRGVRVRVMLDGAGSSVWSSNIAGQLENAGVQVRIFRALPWKIKQWEWSFPRLTWLLKLRQLLKSINRRNHRKICLIDRRLAFVGSFNISKRHLPRDEGGESWRDTAVRLEGLNFDNLHHAFNSAWFDDRSPISRRIFSMLHFRLNHIRRRKLRNDLLNRISQCHSRIWITNAYFVPDLSFLKYLKRAARRGIDVRILLPGTSDIFFIPLATAMFYQSMLQSGMRIFEYTQSILHAKIMILDEWVTVGSSNLDHLSLFSNLEVDVVLNLPSSKTTIQEQFLVDLGHSQEVYVKDLPNRPLWKKVIGRFLLYLKRWL
jgi:cardiolipin synthase A/B